jgi:fatty-acyl-CoA synthase
VGRDPEVVRGPGERRSRRRGRTPEELTAFAGERVADYKTPGEVEFVAELPTTATGKIQKYELREREWDEEERLVGEG